MRDPLDVIAEICQLQPPDALDQIAQALGFVSTERDAAGQLKPRLTVLEQHAIATLNTIKAWRDDGGKTPMDDAQRELEEAIDEVTDWLEYEGYNSKSIEPSLKRLNSARLRMLVLQQRARNAGVEGRKP